MILGIVILLLVVFLYFWYVGQIPSSWGIPSYDSVMGSSAGPSVTNVPAPAVLSAPAPVAAPVAVYVPIADTPAVAMPSTVAMSTVAFPKYLGCYKDQSTRDFPRADTNWHSMQECAKYAKDAGFNVFGVQFARGTDSGECYWGDDVHYGKYGPVQPNDPSDQQCTTDSKGNALGNAWSNAIYTW